VVKLLSMNFERYISVALPISLVSERNGDSLLLPTVSNFLLVASIQDLGN